MADNFNASSSSSDELSQFLRQILNRSSSSRASSSSTAMAHPQSHDRYFSSPPSNFVNRVISTVDLFDRTASGSVPYFSDDARGSIAAANVSSSPMGASGNGSDHEHDCESEEGIGAVVNEPPENPAPARGSSKRSRAAEVHNLSEKKRRCRINEKMKALQKLIPNSNKTDKASMLDEAIEYLKQLQLQVQNLTMRKGLGLKTMSLPRVTQPMQLPRINFRGENPAQTETNQQNQFASFSNISNIIGLEMSFGFESSVQSYSEQFNVLNPSEVPAFVKEVHEDERGQHHRIKASLSNMNLSELYMGGISRAELPIQAEGLSLNNNNRPNITSSSFFTR